jgi:ABC-type multidrug transport system fused ATPase/permease subunit
MSRIRHKETLWLIRQGNRSRWLHLGSLGCVIIGSLLTLLDPLIMRWLIDDILSRQKTILLPLAASAFLITYVGRLAFTSLGNLLTFYAIQRMTFGIKIGLLRHLQRLPAWYHDDTPVGETLFRLEQDVDQIGQIGGDLIPLCLRLVVITAMVVTAMLMMNWQLTCVILPLVPIFIFLQNHYRSRLRRDADATQSHLGRVGSFLQEHFSAILQVQLLTRELAEARRFVKLAGIAMRAQRELRRTALTFSLLSMSTIAVGIAVILGYGGYQVVSGTLTVGGLVAFYSYLTRLFEPLTGAVDITSRMQRVGASIRRILAITEETAPLKDRPGAIVIEDNRPITVELQSVSFSYRADRHVLKDVNFRIRQGDRIALLGASGSGKSTIGKLLTRLYDVQSGAVLINGHDVRDIQLRSLRSSVALVPQETLLFDATLRENLLYGNPKANKDELEKAAELAQLQDLIRQLPQGWEERIGPRGGKLSGGERQRVALARAALRDPCLLILDEPTAALDAQTERELLNLLDQFTRNRTTIIISHRLSTIRWADRVIVLDQGRIIEEETHFQLHRKVDNYQGLCLGESEWSGLTSECSLVLDELDTPANVEA